MASNTTIEWTEATWNPVTGCTKISDGCKNCYAYRFAKRLKAMGNPRYKNCFNVTLHHDLVDAPLRWKKPRRVFVNSMSDLFHKDIPVDFIKKVFTTMNKAKQHNFQILTKRSERLLELSDLFSWSPNIWQGVTVENESTLYRIDDLRKIPASVRFISFEPLIGPIKDVNLEGIHWVIVGGESGPGARPIDIEWVRSIRNECQDKNIPFFFKQWGGVQKHKNGRVLDNQTWSEYPVIQCNYG